MPTPKIDQFYQFPMPVLDPANPGSFLDDPPIAFGDFQVSVNEGAFANVGTATVSNWVKTDADTGVATMSSGHGLINGTYEASWSGGTRTGLTGTFAGDDLTLDGGSGDAFPASATPMTVSLLPRVSPAGSASVWVNLSKEEMPSGGKIVVLARDPDGVWSDAYVFIDADDVNLNDIVRSTTPANTLNVSASGLADANVKELGGSATALATLAALYDGAVARGTVDTVTDSGDFTVTSTDLSSNDFDYDNMWFVMLDGNNKFIPRLIGIYTAGTKRMQFTGTGMAGAFPQTVVTGDAWMVISGSL